MIENNWRSCTKCGALYADGGPSVCAAGDKHDEGASLHYLLTDNTYVQGSGVGNMFGVLGVSTGGDGVHGQSDTTGVFGEGQAYGVHGKSDSGRAIFGENTGQGDGVTGLSASGTGVFGEGPQNGVHGKSASGRAVYGQNTTDGDGVTGESESGSGVAGLSTSGRGVYAESSSWDGVAGISQSGTGVFGTGKLHGVHGKSDSGRAVFGQNTAAGDGVAGESASGTGVAALSNTGTGLYASSQSGPAAHFKGHVEVTGEIRMIGADVAEQFSVPLYVQPGTVMVIDDSGALAVSSGAYDRRVAGVVAGAGHYRPALVLDSEGINESQCAAEGSTQRRAISLIGKAYCRVDASGQPISVGDLLTTAEVPGCAMRATERERAFGAVLGKALEPLSEGTGLISILVSLQ